MWNILTDYKQGYLLIIGFTILFSGLFIGFKITKKTQSWIDFIWIFIGSFSIINFTETNRLFEVGIKYNQFSSFVSNQKSSLNLFLVNDMYCSPPDTTVFDNSYIRNSGLFCNWTKEMIDQIESQTRDSTLVIYPISDLHTSGFESIYNSFIPIINSYNEQVAELLEVEAELKDDTAIRNRNTYGLLFLYIGISLRLSLSIFRLWDEYRIGKEQKKGLIPPQ